MRRDRRQFLGLAAFALCSAFVGPASGQTPPPHPNKKTFQSGDFLWPKEPGTYVPYNAGSHNSYEADRNQWERERNAFLKSVPEATRTREEEQLARSIRGLTFREFQAGFTGTTPPNEPTPFGRGAGAVAVGHVAIVEIDPAGQIWIIEAMPTPGVSRLPYDKWVAQRADQLIWHGRLRERSPADRAKIAVEAKRFIGKPYDFWNFKLDDDKGFYCSKLAWLATYKAVQVALDGDPSTARLRWISPKQILQANTITRLHNPGDYARQ